MSKNFWDKDRYYNLLVSLTNSNSRSYGSLEEKEFQSYRIILENQIFFNDRNLYISLIEEYLQVNTEPIANSLFLYEFSALFRQSLDNLTILQNEILEEGVSRLDNFPINPKSDQFSDLVHAIFSECEFVNEDEMTGDSFQCFINYRLSEMKECIESSIYEDNIVLRETMLFFGFAISIVYSVLNPNLFSIIWQ